MTPSTETQRLMAETLDRLAAAVRRRSMPALADVFEAEAEAARSAGGGDATCIFDQRMDLHLDDNQRCAKCGNTVNLNDVCPQAAPAPAETTAQTDAERIGQLEGWLSEASVAVGGVDLDCVGRAIRERFGKISQNLYKAAQWTEFLPDTRKNAEYLCSAVDQARFHILAAQDQLPKPMTRIGSPVPPNPGPQPVSEPAPVVDDIPARFARVDMDYGRYSFYGAPDSIAWLGRQFDVSGQAIPPSDAAQVPAMKMLCDHKDAWEEHGSLARCRRYGKESEWSAIRPPMTDAAQGKAMDIAGEQCGLCGQIIELGQSVQILPSAQFCHPACAELVTKSTPQDNTLSPEDRAGMFIDWCALSGFGLQGWPLGAYEQLVAHIRGGKP